MSERNLRKTLVGTVVSDKMDKTVAVSYTHLDVYKRQRCWLYGVDGVIQQYNNVRKTTAKINTDQAADKEAGRETDRQND